MIAQRTIPQIPVRGERDQARHLAPSAREDLGRPTVPQRQTRLASLDGGAAGCSVSL